MQLIEDFIPPFQQTHTTATKELLVTGHVNAVTVSTGATLTAAQVLSGYLKCNPSTASTLTLPTGTLLGTALGAAQGDTFELYVDNTAGTALGTVTIAVATNGIKSDAANTTAASFGQLTVATGATGVGRFTIMFTGASSYVFTRTA